MPHSNVDPAKHLLLEEMLQRVPFDGWSQKALDESARAIGMSPETVRTLCPRGAVDLAVADHQIGDDKMTAALRKADLTSMKYRERVAFALRARLDAVHDKEAVRAASALFALPHHAAEGARLIWGTADAIWTALEDKSDDLNWYTKRAILSGVWGSTVLYWLGQEDDTATAAFIDRRIEDVMRFESFKRKVNDAVLLKPFTTPLNKLVGMVKAPSRTARMEMPGSWNLYK
ncbi:MAG: COQ9 family protein [Rhodobacterales bacterium]|nr:COQ9 family protein [Rhodobacterales bacterium]